MHRIIATTLLALSLVGVAPGSAALATGGSAAGFVDVVYWSPSTERYETCVVSLAIQFADLDNRFEMTQHVGPGSGSHPTGCPVGLAANHWNIWGDVVPPVPDVFAPDEVERTDNGFVIRHIAEGDNGWRTHYETRLETTLLGVMFTQSYHDEHNGFHLDPWWSASGPLTGLRLRA